jgi:hypothetical protein
VPQQQQSPLQQRQQQPQLARTPTPDYGEYEDLDDYGSSSRRKKGAKPRAGSAGGAVPDANSALAAANQALAGIPGLPKKVSQRCWCTLGDSSKKKLVSKELKGGVVVDELHQTKMGCVPAVGCTASNSLSFCDSSSKQWT